MDWDVVESQVPKGYRLPWIIVSGRPSLSPGQDSKIWMFGKPTIRTAELDNDDIMLYTMTDVTANPAGTLRGVPSSEKCLVQKSRATACGRPLLPDGLTTCGTRDITRLAVDATSYASNVYLGASPVYIDFSRVDERILGRYKIRTGLIQLLKSIWEILRKNYSPKSQLSS